MRIALAQINVHVGNFAANVEKMIRYIGNAREMGADVVCFPELSTCGYPPRDFLEFDDFIQEAENSIVALSEAATGIAVIVGSVTRNPRIEGKDLFNSAYFLSEGAVRQVQHKALLPTYDVFDEYRYFEPATEFHLVEFKGKRIALTVCEDIWNVGNENPLYTVCPMDELKRQEPDFMINLSASPFAYDHGEERIHVIRANVERYQVPVFYVNPVGAQTELIFEGGSIVMSPDGQVFDEMPYFEECLRVYDLVEVMKGGTDAALPKEKNQLIHDALILGIRDYFAKTGLQRAILGLSGGIDSALTLVLTARAIGADHVRVLLMPSPFSSDHSVNDARQLAENLGVQYDIVPIASVFSAYEALLAPYFAGRSFDLTEENLQARIRGMLLMAFSNKFGNILLNTSNKSEIAVGYGTLYGDMCGGLCVIGDVYKTEVYALARFINQEREIIPENILVKPPSAELRPNQKDSDSLPDYDLLDQVLYQYIEMQRGPREIIEQGYDEALVRRVLRLVNISEFKRHQTAPVLRVSRKAFGMGRRMPIEGKYLSA